MIKTMLLIIKKSFIVLLSNIVNGFNHKIYEMYDSTSSY